MAGSGFNIRAWLGLDTKSFQRGLKGAQGKLTKFQRGLRGVNDVLRGLKFAAVGVTAVGAFSRAVNTLKDFQTNMARVKVITQASDAEIIKLTASAREIGATTRFTASEAASGLQYLGMAGFTANESLKALPSTLNLAGAGMLDVGRSADIITNVISGFKLEVEEAAMVSDVFAQASRKSNQTVDELYEGIKLIAPGYNSLGLSIRDAAIDMSLLANNGIKAEQAGTALAGVLSRLLRQPPMVADALNKLGVEITENKIRNEGLIGVMTELRDAGITTTQMASILGRHWKTAGALIGSTNEEIDELTHFMNNANGASKKMSDEGIGSLDKAIRLLNSALDELFISLGYEGGIGSFLESIINTTRNLVIWFTNLSDSAKVLNIAMLALLFRGRAFITNLIFTVKNLRFTRIAFLRAAVAVRAFSRTLKISSVVGIALLAIEALVVAMSSYKSETEKAIITQKKFNNFQKDLRSFSQEELNLAFAKSKIERDRSKETIKNLQKEKKLLKEKQKDNTRSVVIADKIYNVNQKIEKASKAYNEAEQTYNAINLEFLRRKLKNKSDEYDFDQKRRIEAQLKAEAELAAAEKEKEALNFALTAKLDEFETIKDLTEAIKLLDKAKETANKKDISSLNERINLLKKEKEFYDKISISKFKDATKIQSKGLPSNVGSVQYGSKKERVGLDTPISLQLKGIPETIERMINLQEQLGRPIRSPFEQYKAGLESMIKVGNLFEKGILTQTDALMQQAAAGEVAMDNLGNAILNAARKAVASFIAEGVAATVKSALEEFPAPYNIIIAAAAGAGAAALFNSIVPAFEAGGIMPGQSFTGDNRIARINSGEMILNRAQQATLFRIANGHRNGLNSGSVEFEIRGDKLVGVLKNVSKKNNSFT